VEAFRGQIEYAATHSVDYKTELQEELARVRKQVVYTVVEMEGPAHDRRFTCAALIDGEQRGIGSGSTKKEAEQEAALQALEWIQEEQPDS
jgi:ribonuclease-3